MNDHELNRERRKQRALGAIGNEHSPLPLLRLSTNRWSFELHHVAGRAFDDANGRRSAATAIAS